MEKQHYSRDKARRGDYVGVRVFRRGHVSVNMVLHEQERPPVEEDYASYRLARVVKTNREGIVTHVCSEHEWSNGTVRANKGNELSYNNITNVYLLPEGLYSGLSKYTHWDVNSRDILRDIVQGCRVRDQDGG